MRKITTLALMLGSLAAPLTAAEHEVLMMGNGYFPDYVYPELGDTIVFRNASDIAMSATATDDSWTTGALQPGAAAQLLVAEGMTQTFRDTVQPDNPAAGVIDYINPAPLQLEENVSN